MENYISIIIPIWNAYERTIECLNQFNRVNYRKENIEIIIKDNASSDICMKNEFLNVINFMKKEGWNIIYIYTDTHPGLTESFNDAYKHISNKSNYIVRLDNDVEMLPDTLKKMVTYMNKNKDIGIMGPKIVYKKDPDKINASAIFINRFGLKNTMVNASAPIECDVLLEAFFIMNRNCSDAMGRIFDSTLFLFAEGIECCQNVNNHNYKVVYFPYTLVKHDTALSTGRHSLLSEYLNIRNHVITYNSKFDFASNLIRNIISLTRYSVKFDLFRVRALYDGLMHKKLTQKWWECNLSGKEFKFPKEFDV
jgi:GT2 family glycosyltransferase